MKLTIHNIIISSVLLLASCGEKNTKMQQQAPPPIDVNVDTAKQVNAVYFEEYPGTVNALNQVDIHAQVSGYITEIYFEDGQHVAKGQKLYKIDAQQYAGNYNQSVADLNVAKANLEKAQKNADRYIELDKDDAIAKQIVDNAMADLDAAKMQVKAAEANVSAVQTNLRYTTIYAPFDGVIGISQVKLGSAVAPGSTVLNTISAEKLLAVDFALDEKEIPRFTKLQREGTNPADSVFTIQLPDGSIYDEPGKIVLIDRAVDPQTGTIKARLEFDNPQNMLKPGMTCNVRVKTDAINALMIPTKAIMEQMGENFVFVVGDSNRVAQTKIVKGKNIDGNTIIQSGLQPGEIIITDGVQKVRDGAVVKLTNSLDGH
ncbi:MAG: efflux RND transporter periplasmic adaptor subunit [Bacteroidetes bacterium]|nr:efflux RND transporter periplasmic adaptor subunit [Bacteroidota bacterium]